MKLIASESDEQIAYIEWLKYFHPRVAEVTHHSPNEGKRSGRYGKFLNRLGMSKGFPDIFIFLPNRFYFGLALEFKREDQRNKKSFSQDNWLYNLNQNGYLACYVFGAEEAIKITTEYLANRK